MPFKSEDAPSEGPSISPYLLDFGQWVSCIQIGNENDVFMNYQFAKDGQIQDVRLKCGNDYYGYRHIKKKHETDWNKLMTAGEALGWVPESQGIESWDDLMAQSAGMVLFGWQNTGYNPGNSKRCAIAKVQWYRMDTFQVVLSKRIIVVFATDSDRLITAYPPKDQNTQTCYPS
ncbi:hypothetical protein ACQUSY_07170 [Microbacterium sp. YY-03]|uniref:hypothetical protein n=1 Tax=Microbacterium sp. YY-03 TaxID=3421636 RepID=UPI003D186E34